MGLRGVVLGAPPLRPLQKASGLCGLEEIGTRSDFSNQGQGHTLFAILVGLVDSPSYLSLGLVDSPSFLVDGLADSPDHLRPPAFQSFTSLCRGQMGRDPHPVPFDPCFCSVSGSKALATLGESGIATQVPRDAPFRSSWRDSSHL